MRALLTIGLVCLLSCTEDSEDRNNPFEIPDTEVRCEDASSTNITVVVTSGTGQQRLGGDVTLSGTARQSKGLAIRRLTVDGVAVTAGRLNYATWSVVIPAASLGKVESGPPLELAIEAEDACGSTFSSKETVTLVAPLSGLDVTVTYPNPEAPYLPATGDAQAIVRVSADASAIGAPVTVRSSDPALVFLGRENEQVTLQAAENEKAAAQVLVSGEKAGTYTIEASGEGQSSLETVRIIGPALIFPGQATLGPGDTLDVNVITEGVVQSCQATPSAGITVTSGGQNIAITPAADDADGDGSIDLTVTTSDMATAPASVSVTCRDPFGQVTTVATYELVP